MMKFGSSIFAISLVVLAGICSCTKNEDYSSYFIVGVFNHTHTSLLRVFSSHAAESSSGISSSTDATTSGQSSVTGSDAHFYCGDKLTLFYVHSGEKINSPSVTVYMKIGDDNIALERKEDYDLVLASEKDSPAEATFTQRYEVVYVAPYVIPETSPGPYIVTFCASDGTDVLDKNFFTIEIEKGND